MQRRGCIDCRFNRCDAACLVIQSMLVAVCYVGLHCLLCWSSMLIVCYDTDQASHPCCKAAAAPLLRSMTWANKTRAAAAARALHQCVHLCRFYRCAAACLMIQSRLVAGCSMIADSTAVMLLATDSTAVMLLADSIAVLLHQTSTMPPCNGFPLLLLALLLQQERFTNACIYADSIAVLLLA